MRVAIGSVMQESNSFVPFQTNLEVFKNNYFYEGKQVLTAFGEARVEVPGMLSVIESEGMVPAPLIAAHGNFGGPVSRDSFEFIMEKMIARLTSLPSVDGILLALHGAMCVEDEPDAESEIIERVRAIVGDDIPIGVSLDLHGHITERMLQPGVFYVGYREFPHIDIYETGVRVANLMVDVLRGRRNPVMALRKLPLIVSPVKARTGEEPLASVVSRAREMEAAGDVLCASLFPVQPWLDIPELGFASLVCANGNELRAQNAADELAQMVWERRDGFEPELVSLDQAIDVALGNAGLTVVSDSGDAPSGGAAADNPSVLDALLKRGLDNYGRLVFLTLCDPKAAKVLASHDLGAKVTVDVGHALSVDDGKPLTVTGRVLKVSDGDFIMQDKGGKGSVCRLGDTVVLAIGDIRLFIRSNPAFEWDTGIFEAFGGNLREASLVFVKSPSHFRTSYEAFADRILVADTSGPTTPNMHRLKFNNLTRPLYPLDAVTVAF